MTQSLILNPNQNAPSFMSFPLPDCHGSGEDQAVYYDQLGRAIGWLYKNPAYERGANWYHWITKDSVEIVFYSQFLHDEFFKNLPI